MATVLCFGSGPQKLIALGTNLTLRAIMHYAFAMTPGPADARGLITKYTVVARPEKPGHDGWCRFFIDESG